MMKAKVSKKYWKMAMKKWGTDGVIQKILVGKNRLDILEDRLAEAIDSFCGYCEYHNGECSRCSLKPTFCNSSLWPPNINDRGKDHLEKLGSYMKRTENKGNRMQWNRALKHAQAIHDKIRQDGIDWGYTK